MHKEGQENHPAGTIGSESGIENANVRNSYHRGLRGTQSSKATTKRCLVRNGNDSVTTRAAELEFRIYAEALGRLQPVR